VATGVVEAAKKISVNIPMIVRLAGTNAEEAAQILNKSGLKFLVANSFQEAAKRVVEALAN
jgi:succinyl-CoA synthetase beta subunit